MPSLRGLNAALLIAFGGAMSVLLPQGASAQEHQAEVVRSCVAGQDGDAVAMALCSSYIEGFLDGALVTDTAIVNNISSGKGGAEASDFMTRAYQTRVGSSRGVLPATYLAEFCLPADLPRSSLVERLAKLLASHRFDTAKRETVADALYDEIKRSFPC
tara:strand:- start:83025 stop:83501 length:477 start_codon:yes stop_codon:yes gene_type:complete